MKKLLHIWLVINLILILASNATPTQAQVGAARDMLSRMSPAERVGQLFLVTFYGSSITAGSDIERLIAQYRIGGVVLVAANDNITDTVNAPAQVQQLTQALQNVAVVAAQGVRDAPEATAPEYVPLFVALDHSGVGQIRSGLTPLPSPMAIGAAWSEAHAQAIGEIAGTELAALGVNLLLGPALDVMETPRPRGEGDLGSRVFGGDPFWVGQLGRAYIRGVQLGSQNGIAVVAQHFPGRGSIDRDPDGAEVPIVRKCPDQLQQIDLKPFASVTDAAPGAAGVTDALMSGHIRFQCLQGNLYETTEPISLDPRAFTELLEGSFKTWRDGGGVTVSESLGARAIVRRYDPSERRFDAARIARDALFAGNDVLYLADFGLNPSADHARNIEATLQAFESLYGSDPTFAKRVDAAVERILALKLRLYGGAFEPERVLAERDLGVVGQGRALVLELAQDVATLIYPSEESLPVAPARTDRLLFITDTRTVRQCSECLAVPVLEQRALENAELQFYGSTNQINPNNLQSFSFDELGVYLFARANPAPTPEPGTPTPEPSAIETALQQATWIVFAMQDISSTTPNSDLVRALLSQRADLAATKRLVVFAFGAPYYLDTTDLSKLAAFYALYSPAPPFVEVAARLLFRELLPQGHSPVTVDSVGYNLAAVIAPTINQTIQLCVSSMPDNTPCDSATTQPLTPTVQLRFGDTLYLRSTVIVDENGNTAPDGTAVRFRVVITGEDAQVLGDSVLDALTMDGVANTSLLLDKPGLIEISVVTPAARADIIRLFVQPGANIGPTVIAPPTNTPTVTPIPSQTPVPPTPTNTVTPELRIGEVTPGLFRVEPMDFVLMIVGVVVATLGGYRLGNGNRRYALRLALLGAVGVVASYNYIAFGLPGANWMTLTFPRSAPFIAMVMGTAAALTAGWYWMRQQRK
ncbi:MAG: glycoside hydrolase family 3 N-terminal domain-containing protein [Anaerolineales bacterium]